MRRYKFRFHYNKPKGKISIHYKGKCHLANSLTCYTNCFSELREKQPKCVMWGYADTLEEWQPGKFLLDNRAGGAMARRSREKCK